MCAARSTWRSVAPSRASVAAIFSGCAQVGLFFPPWRGGPLFVFPAIALDKKQKSREEKKRKTTRHWRQPQGSFFYMHLSFPERKVAGRPPLHGGAGGSALLLVFFLRPACGRRERVAVGRPKRTTGTAQAARGTYQERGAERPGGKDRGTLCRACAPILFFALAIDRPIPPSFFPPTTKRPQRGRSVEQKKGKLFL
ncbi:hypothetical protein TW95_gp1597 [Pandoravirus inopinatum]|uniref:Uncharacterized protein n=1 Tax=Pandoravirus inopinatum TaxID=1605721 RepID=A0A0B5JBE4_9VIRU|nr:hypothetical protein TW95_gp1597 [Pandoravirus inopinatum]AJF98331.1 hypothetical protein [Pandoravirus inopinatum]